MRRRSSPRGGGGAAGASVVEKTRGRRKFAGAYSSKVVECGNNQVFRGWAPLRVSEFRRKFIRCGGGGRGGSWGGGALRSWAEKVSRGSEKVSVLTQHPGKDTPTFAGTSTRTLSGSSKGSGRHACLRAQHHFALLPSFSRFSGTFQFPSISWGG